MYYKKFFILFMVLVIFFISIVCVVNYYFDVYAVFKQDKEVYYGNINYRFAKTAHILKNKEKYDTFIYGSSRVQKMNPLIINAKSYNMGSPSALPEDCLRDLMLFINNNIEIKNIYLGIDNFSYKLDYRKLIQNFDMTPYNENNLNNKKYLFKMLLKVPDYDKIKPYLKLTDRNLVRNDLLDLGMLEIPQYTEYEIESLKNKYISNEKFNKPYYFDDNNEHIYDTILIIRKIKKLCDDNNIKLVVFFNPVHITSYLKDDIHLSNRFKKELVKITDFYDFNYINFVSINNYFWYETSHPRYFVCDWELKVITNQFDKNIPKDFGRLITKDNVDYYCEKYLKERMEFKKPSKQYIPEVPII